MVKKYFIHLHIHIYLTKKYYNYDIKLLKKDNEILLLTFNKKNKQQVKIIQLEILLILFS